MDVTKMTDREFKKHKAAIKEEEARRKGEKKDKPKTEYQTFMKEELAKYKKANPDVDHKKAFKDVAESWTKKKGDTKDTKDAKDKKSE